MLFALIHPSANLELYTSFKARGLGIHRISTNTSKPTTHPSCAFLSPVTAMLVYFRDCIGPELPGARRQVSVFALRRLLQRLQHLRPLAVALDAHLSTLQV